jgi:hypothetical protein
MPCLYNPDWRKQGDTWMLTNGVGLGTVRSISMSNYSWEVLPLEGGSVIASGDAPDRIAAQTAVEEFLGYYFTVEPEYEMSAGCRCGSCVDPTGKWLVSNRSDTVNETFDSEGEAIAWIMNQHASGSET